MYSYWIEVSGFWAKLPLNAVITGVVIWGLVVAASLFVYLDALRNRIGPNSEVDRGFNRSLKPGEIASVVLWLNVFGFFEYLRTREERIRRATDYPCEKSGLVVYIVSLVLFAVTLPFFPLIALL